MPIKCNKIPLTARLRPDPLGELKCIPRPPSHNQGGPTSKGKVEGKGGRGRQWRGGKGGERGREGKEWKGNE